MKGFFIEITNRLLEGKHRKAMGESVWLFMWLLDRMTSINESGVGKVLGGKPIKYEDVNDDLDLPERTYRRWVSILKNTGYINTLRTPYGIVISVNKAKKRFGKRDVPKMAHPDMPKSVRDVPKSAERTYQSGTSNIRQYQDNTIDRDFNFQKEGMKPLSHSEFLKSLSVRAAENGATN